MKNLSERMNLASGEVENAHVIKNVNLGLAAFDTLCLACSELNIDLKDVSEVDFEAASDTLSAFCNELVKQENTTVSIWFD